MRKNILFCGTPQFATASLKSIVKHQDDLNYRLVGVVTIPDKKAGRGQKFKESAVKKEAKLIKTQIFEPTNLSDAEFINEIKKLNLDLIIVVAFQKLPAIFFNIPKIGTINLHASLLPQYRGAAPINWAIINGEKHTGLTTFFINKNIDTGDIILQSKIEIDETWHADDLHNKLMEESDQIIYNTIRLLIHKNYETINQKDKIKGKNLKHAPKIHKSDRIMIDNSFFTHQTVKSIYNFIRGMSPPGVKTSLIIHEKKSDVNNINSPIKTKNIIITKVGNYTNQPNHFLIENKRDIDLFRNNKDKIIVTNGLESFNIEKLKLENGKEITSKEFCNGFLKNKNHYNTISFKKTREKGD